MKKVNLYSTDEEVLRRMLAAEDTIDWSTYFLIGGMNYFPKKYNIINMNSGYLKNSGYFSFLGCDLRHSPMLKETAASRGVSVKGLSLVHLMTLTEPSHFPELITR